MDGDGRNLREEVKRVVAQMDRARDRSDRLSEADTKAAFIEPILSSLGWDLRDVFSVSREYRHRPQDNPVDYALFIARSPVLFVEAKSLSKDLCDYKWVSQTIAYANAAGVEWCALTNGDEYKIYNAFAKAEADKKLFRSFKLSEAGDLSLAVDTLLLLSSETLAEKRIDVLWREQFVDGKVRDAVTALFIEPDESLVRLIVKKTDQLRPPEVRESLRRCGFDLRYPQTAHVDPVLDEAARKPALGGNNGGEAASEEVERRPRVRIRDLITAGLVVPPVEIECTYKGTRLTATIADDGLIHFDGATYGSPAHAGGVAKNKVSGPPPDGKEYWSTGGWGFWRYRDSDTGELEPIAKWREQLKGLPG